MREITDHQINECNQAISITADEPDPKGCNASHHYAVIVHGAGVEPPLRIDVLFQRGPIKEAGVNGITNEVLLAILIDRLSGFQNGQYRCRENALALTKLEEARHWLEARTRARVARGVEGTHTV